ncbi:hypothetical protein FRB94_010940 [Tulasnella sp. JGI-2019a]|nr:hypothetical protein FRB94_010940 [Tulasnella sp. JGI-2019a]
MQLRGDTIPGRSKYKTGQTLTNGQIREAFKFKFPKSGASRVLLLSKAQPVEALEMVTPSLSPLGGEPAGLGTLDISGSLLALAVLDGELRRILDERCKSCNGSSGTGGDMGPEVRDPEEMSTAS